MKWLQRLQDPYLTLKFQKLCGLEPAPVEEGEVCPSLDVLPGTGDSSPAPREEKHLTRRRAKLSNDKLNNNINNGCHSDGMLPLLDNDSDSDMSTNGQGQRKPTKHKINNKFFYYIFSFAACLGEEPFYLTFFPYCVWNLDMVVVRECVIVWSLGMYFGQAAKDVLRWPRPSAPPVFRLETNYAQEYSMPSTHAIAGTAIPFMLAYSTAERYQISMALVMSIATVWCILVCLSRLYLGVHSILDLLCGFLFSVVICAAFIPFRKEIQLFLQVHPTAPYITFLVVFLLSTVCYPKQEDHNRTKGDAVQVIATTGGVLIGSWFNHLYGVTRIVEHTGLFVIAQPSLKFFATSILRFLIGIVVLALVRTVVKPISIKMSSYCLGLEKPDKKDPGVETAYKFITYMSMGVAIVCTIPMVHCTVGLCRPSFFTEIV